MSNSKKSLQNVKLELVPVNGDASTQQIVVNGEKGTVWTLNENGTAVSQKPSIEIIGIMGIAFDYCNKIEGMALSTWVQIRMNNFYAK